MTQPLTAIILAAGYSSRMGAFKPLLPFGGTTVLERSVAMFRSAGVNDIRVVTGHRASDLLPLLERLQVQPLLNSNYQEGMFSSMYTAAASLAGGSGAFFLLPVDIPLVRHETVALLARSFGTAGKGIIYPACRGERGHPPLIATAYREEILAWQGYGGLKALLMRHEADATTIETGDEGILLDMDTPEDYEQLQEALPKATTPSRQVCEQLLMERFAADSPLIRHSRAVACLALLLAKRLNACDDHLDLALIESAALLHDLAKGAPRHAVAGAAMLKAMGYGAVADLVAVHMELPPRSETVISAAELLFLADKLLDGDRIIPLETRFQQKLARFAGNLRIQATIMRRFESARSIQQRVETQLGVSLTDILLAAPL